MKSWRFKIVSIFHTGPAAGLLFSEDLARFLPFDWQHLL